MPVNLKVSCNTIITAQQINDPKELKVSPSVILDEAWCKVVKVAKYELLAAGKQTSNNRT